MRHRNDPPYGWTVFKIVLALALVSGGLWTLVAVGTATPQVDYYNNSSGVVQSNVSSNATFDNILDLAVGLSPSFIGTGDVDPSGTGFEGVLLIGLVFATVSLGTMLETRVGPMGGLVVGTIVAYGLVDAGFAPPWVKPLLLFGIGGLAVAAFRRVIQQ